MWVSLYICKSLLMPFHLTPVLLGTNQVKHRDLSWEKSLLQWKNAAQRLSHCTVSYGVSYQQPKSFMISSSG